MSWLPFVAQTPSPVPVPTDFCRCFPSPAVMPFVVAIVAILDGWDDCHRSDGPPPSRADGEDRARDEPGRCGWRGFAVMPLAAHIRSGSRPADCPAQARRLLEHPLESICKLRSFIP